MSTSKNPAWEDLDNDIVCYLPTMVTTTGVWQKDNPLDYAFPLFMLQLTVTVLVIRLLMFILKPLHQPPIVAELLGGLILGPSLLGKYVTEKFNLLPLRGILVLEFFASIGIQYFVFLVGVQMDLSLLKRTGKKVVHIAMGSMILPFAIGYGFNYVLPSNDHHLLENNTMQPRTYALFLSITLAVTTFSVIAHILAEHKLINTEIGRLAMSSAVFNEISAWVLLALALAMSGPPNDSGVISFWIILSTLAFVAFCFLVIRPIVAWMIRTTPEGESISDLKVSLILTLVLILGYVTEITGTHPIIGAFVFGLTIPSGPLAVILIDKLEDFVSGLLLPVFCIVVGSRTSVFKIIQHKTWINISIVTVIACIGKICATVVVSQFHQVTVREGITLGLLMNSKGIVELIILNIGLERKVLDDCTFSVMVIAIFLTTGLTGPLVSSIYRAAKGKMAYRHRTLESIQDDPSELRILSCIHSSRNVPTMAKLLESTHPTKRSPLCVYILHLIELTGRASNMLIVHNTQKSSSPSLSASASRGASSVHSQSDSIFDAFEGLDRPDLGGAVSVHSLTAISAYSSMHEDICNLAADKRVTMIVLPFHQQQTVDGSMASVNPALQAINQNVLTTAPCSVGILVDRWSDQRSTTPLHDMAVLFFGGPDDREALAYAWWMSDNSRIALTVVRFVLELNGSSLTSRVNHSNSSADHRHGELDVITDVEHERKLDEDYLHEFRRNTAGNNNVKYEEKTVGNTDEITAVIRSTTGENNHDLYIVGRGQGMIISPLITAGLNDWSECPELGPIGELLASSDWAANSSVLVVQQYVNRGNNGGIMHGLTTPLSLSNCGSDFDNNYWNLKQGYNMNGR